MIEVELTSLSFVLLLVLGVLAWLITGIKRSEKKFLHWQIDLLRKENRQYKRMFDRMIDRRLARHFDDDKTQALAGRAD